jgi:hypothetical protein
MTTRRWMEEGATQFERRLLGSAQGDGPSPQARQAARGALGLGAIAAAELGGAGAGVSTLHAKFASGVFAKWIVVGGLSGTAIVGSLEYAREHPPDASPAAASASTLTAPAPRAKARAASVARRDVTAEPTAALTPLAAKRATPIPAVAPAPPAEPAPTLADETAALDAVRAALETASGGAALGLLDGYDRRFVAGSLRSEATVLRVEALLAAGRRAEAVALATRQISADPTSAHAARLRSLVEAPGR